MINWLRRWFFLILIIVGGAGWYFYAQWLNDRAAMLEAAAVTVTAQLWVASADFRDDPGAYAAYRDSLIATTGLEPIELASFTGRHADEPEQYMRFVEAVNLKVDSLLAQRGTDADKTPKAKLRGAQP